MSQSSSSLELLSPATAPTTTAPEIDTDAAFSAPTAAPTVAYTSGHKVLQHEGGVYHVAFSPSGERVATTSHSYMSPVAVWNAVSGQVESRVETMDEITEVIFSATDDSLIIGGCGSRLVVWDVSGEAAEEVHALEGHEARIMVVGMSRGGSRVVSCSMDGRVCVWDTASWSLAHTLETPRGDDVPANNLIGQGVAVSNDGKLAATYDDGQDIFVWDLVEGKLVRTLSHETSVNCAVFSADATLLFVGAQKGVHVWHLNITSIVRTLGGFSDWVEAMVLSPDGKQLAACSRDSTLRVWSATKGTILHALDAHADVVVSVQFSPDSSLLASCSADKTVCLFDAASGEMLQTYAGHKESVGTLAFSPDSSRLVSGSMDATARFWHLACGEVQQRLPRMAAQRGQSLAFHPMDSTTLVVCSHESGLLLVSADTGQVLQEVHGPEGTEVFAGVAPVPDGQLAAVIPAVATDPAHVLFIIPELVQARGGDAALATLTGHTARLQRIVVAPTALVAGMAGSRVHVWNIEGDLMFTLEDDGSNVQALEFSPDGELLAYGGTGGTARVHSMSTGEALHTFKCGGRDHGNMNQIRSLAFSPDGSMLASSANLLEVWDINTGKRLHALPGPDDLELQDRNGIKKVVFSPDGRRIAASLADMTTGRDGGLFLWEPKYGEFIARLEGHVRTEDDFVFSSDSSTLVSCSRDTTVRVWSAETGEAVNVLRGYPSWSDEVHEVRISPDDSRLATMSISGLILVWDLKTAPTFDEMATHYMESAEDPALALKAKLFPQITKQRAADDGVYHFAGESILHVLARRGFETLLRSVLDASEHADPLQHGPRGSPLLVAIEAANDSCVDALLEAAVQRCNSTPHWHISSEGLTAAMPLLAKLYPKALLKALQRMELPTVPDQHLSVLRDCSHMPGMATDETFRTHGNGALCQDRLWALHFDSSRDKRQVGSEGTDLEATVVPVEGLAGPEHATKPLKAQPIGALVEHGLVDALGTPVVRSVLDFKWERYARGVFVSSMRVFLLLVALFTLATVQDECYELMDGDGWWRFVRAANDVAVLVLALYHLRLELRQLRKEGVKAYAANVWNVLDVVGLLLILVLVPFRVFCWQHASTLQSVAAVCLWLKLLDFARAFRTTGPFVRMVFRIANSIGFFMLVLIVVMVAFSHGFFLLFRDLPDVEASEAGGAFDFGTAWVLLKVYSIMVFGDYDRTVLALSRSEALAVIYVVAFSAFATILMLNLLIALMGFVYGEVQDNVENEWLLERAQIVLDIDQYMTKAELAREDEFPRWVHVLRAKFAEKQAADVSTHDVHSGVERLSAQVNARLDGMDAKIGEIADQLKRVARMLEAGRKAEAERQERE